MRERREGDANGERGALRCCHNDLVTAATIAEPGAGAPRAGQRPPIWRMARTNIVLGASVFVLWLLLGGERALAAVADHWQVSLTMVFGSLVGGGTSEGGGAVAFPVLTKVLAVPADQARLFSFAIQSVGMGAATATIVYNRVAIEWRAIRFGGPAVVAGVAASCLVLAPRLEPSTVRLLFTAILASLCVALFISRRVDPHRRDWIEPFGRREIAIIVAAGVLGGLLSGLAAVGENTIMFVALVLGLRVCERVVTPTTVMLLTLASWTGFATHVLVLGDFSGPVVDMWLAAVPVVAVGAPTGALICTRLSRDAIVRILYVLIAAEFVSTVLLVPRSPAQTLGFGAAIAVFSVACLRMATAARYRVLEAAGVSGSSG
jgi:uncharacterized membrane protein YfcA